MKVKAVTAIGKTTSKVSTVHFKLKGTRVTAYETPATRRLLSYDIILLDIILLDIILLDKTLSVAAKAATVLTPLFMLSLNCGNLKISGLTEN